MITKEKVTVSWSGGKDCALALEAIINSEMYEIVHLHTVIDSKTKRVGMHGVLEALIEAQAQAINLPLVKLYLDSAEDNTVYAELMHRFYTQCVQEGLKWVLLGDIYLEDLRKYRESLLEGTGLRALFPLWGHSTSALVTGLIEKKFLALTCCCNQAVYDAGLLGSYIDKSFVTKLPTGIDRCGEKGEFHTYVVSAPYFNYPVAIKKKEIVSKTYKIKHTTGEDILEDSVTFWFQEIVPLMVL
jgi:uncharacterized protein (TIGR00290 family)